ncbi:redox-regulated ATPase YchF [Candidatus Cerribacteria bacterium 'Amazon FNV 2010 28 9']|uniref:Ribosome-binding ATPase YchF n=1 Tax=Candidatus Cerribacteria bacterium 'Amazon FNV 2010 28 9' TaxID=2081795 RepID=A0A317JQK0_9BACT|nr:MAG: redox-regulated ATPase YchF [Candidatus Cerribacteria bacterium 'Amazon FNV 2010 28 9']
MSLSVGIVGLPNVGKSTLFNALLKKQQALAANYPFATIDPNTGIVPVPDDRLEKLAAVVHTSVIKPASVEFVDIAGLVKGASQGEGLGNQFLSHIREVDLICHVVRAFSDSNVIREGSVDPKTDRDTIETELLLADLQTLQKQREPKMSKDKDELFRWEVVKKMRAAAEKGTQLRDVLKTDEEKEVGRTLGLLTAKPMIYVANVDEGELGDRGQGLGVSKLAEQLGVDPDSIVIVSAKIESELSILSDEDQKLYMQDLGIQQSGLERLAKKAYERLGLQSFLTAGELEVRAWTIHAGTNAQLAAGVIHTDFIKKFIKANIASYADFVAFGGWKGVREAGKMRIEGRDYIMHEGDIVEFMIGA